MSSAEAVFAPDGRTSARRIDGKPVAARSTDAVARAAAELTRTAGVRPSLTVVIVGEDSASLAYVGTKERMRRPCRRHSVHHDLVADITQADLLALVETLDSDPAVHGIMVQLPLPGGLDSARVTAATRLEKDVDGLHRRTPARSPPATFAPGWCTVRERAR